MGDADGMGAVVAATGLFPDETLPSMMGAAVSGEAVVGLAYAVPEPLTHGTLNMLELGVLPDAQGRGVGKVLVAALEARLRADGRRLLIVETSETEAFAAARGFYRAAGYQEAARIWEYWADGDDKVTFRKMLHE